MPTVWRAVACGGGGGGGGVCFVVRGGVGNLTFYSDFMY